MRCALACLLQAVLKRLALHKAKARLREIHGGEWVLADGAEGVPGCKADRSPLACMQLPAPS